jgi:hypothetical protein
MATEIQDVTNGPAKDGLLKDVIIKKSKSRKKPGTRKKKKPMGMKIFGPQF